ncbi:MAG: HAD family phosphatase [Desulfuromonadales bacterium]|nr:HAD family phosphatase [Desulfuromonadales bacterium]
MVTLKNNIQVQAVIFDFDGVIVDTEPLHYKAFQRILNPRGLGFSWDQYVKTYMGFDDRDAFMEAFKAKGIALDREELTRLIADKAAIFQTIICEGINAYPGVVTLIKTLHKAQLPLAICSGALRSDILPILDLLNVRDCFDCIVSAEDVVKSKPDPACYRIAYSLLRATRPESVFSTTTTVAIEDTPAGISAATQAGLQVIAVTNSYPRDQLTEASHTVDSLEQVLEIHAV